MKPSKDIRHLVLFMAMGDGSLNSNGYLSVRHCIDQKDYLEWKRNLLKNSLLTTDCYFVKNNDYGANEFRSKTYKFIKMYRRILYKNGKKNIANRRLLDKLTPLGISIWYMDDGGLSQKKRDGIIVANDLILNTHLTKDENQIIIDYFNEKWNIQFTQVKNRGLYRLRCGTKEARKFIEIVEPYVSQVKSMAHKLKVKSLTIEKQNNSD
jgi:hypothetical protein